MSSIKQPPLLSRRRNAEPWASAALTAVCLGLVGLLLASGCGSGKQSKDAGRAGGTGRARLTIAWPEETRHIPFAAQRIAVRISDSETNECYYGEGCRGPAFTIDYPKKELELTPLPVRRKLTFQLEAFAQDGTADGSIPIFSAVPVARGTATMDVPLQPQQSPIPEVPVTLTETVTTLRVFSGSTLLYDGRDASKKKASLSFRPTDSRSAKVDLRVEALDSDGRTVLLRTSARTGANSDIEWTPPAFIALASRNGAENTAGRQSQVANTGTLTITYNGQARTNNGQGPMKPTAEVDVILGQETVPGLQTTPLTLDKVTTVSDPGFAGDDFDVSADGAEAFLMATRTIRVSTFSTAPEPVTTVSTLNSNRRYLINSFYQGRFALRLTAFPDIAQVRDGYREDLPVLMYNHASFNPLNQIAPIATDNFFVDGAIISFFDPSFSTADVEVQANDLAQRTLAARSEGQLFILSSGGVLTVKNITRNENLPPTITDAGLTYDNAPDAINLAVDDSTEKPRVYRASEDTVRKNTETNGADLITAGNRGSAIPPAPANPSGERLDTIEDIAAESGYLYILSKNADGVRRVHIFTIVKEKDKDGNDKEEAKWLYSVKPDAGVEGAVNGADRARIAAGAVVDGSGRLFLAYRNGATAAVLQYFRPKDE